LGYRVLTASTPDEAFTVAGAYTDEIKLLITDVVMPNMSGRDLAKELIALYPGLTSLFMSGYPSNIITPHGVLDDGINFIEKPFSIQALAAKVRQALDSATKGSHPQ
jgi:DNA-binding NtrC family response regulator